jgi:hypothetical protein
LARAPLADHLIVLRRLAESDPSTPFWDTDLRAFEKARIEEIRSEVRTLSEGHDHEQLAKLKAETQRSNWRTPVSKDLRQQIEASLQRAQSTTGEILLRELLPELNAAYSAMNLAECKEVVSRWAQIVQAAAMTVPQALEDQIRPVTQWLEEEGQKASLHHEFEAACQILQQGLDRDAPDAELERAFRITTAFALELPPELEAQYHGRLKSRESRRKHRQRMIYLSIAAAQAVGLVVAGWRVVLVNGAVAEVPFSTGSSFAVSPSGYLLTNKHVIERIENLQRAPALREALKGRLSLGELTPVVWVFFEQEKFVAEIVFTSPRYDVAILKVQRPNQAYFRLADKLIAGRGRMRMRLAFQDWRDIRYPTKREDMRRLDKTSCTQTQVCPSIRRVLHTPRQPD